MPLRTWKLLLFLLSLIWTGESLANTERDLAYIQSYIDSKIGFDTDALIKEIKGQKMELTRQLRIGARVHREMGNVSERLSTTSGREELEKYVDGLNEEERNAPQKVQQIAASMKKRMAKLFEALSVQLAVMTVIEEGCGRSESSENWQELFFRLISDMKGKFSPSTIARIDEAYMSNLDVAATEFGSGSFAPSCTAQLENNENLDRAKKLLGGI